MIETTLTRCESSTDGVATTFPFPFPTLDAAHLRVVAVAADGVSTTLRLGIDYLVSGVGSASGGSVVCAPAPPPSGRLVIERVAPAVQLCDLRNASSPRPETIEDALDYVTMLVQQILTVSGTSADDGRALRLADDGTWRARAARLADLADPVSATDAATLGAVQRAVLGAITGAEVVLPRAWRATGDGAATGFPLLGATLVESAAYDVQVGGVMQRPDVDYVVHPETQTIVFDAAPPAGVDVVVVCRGYAVPVPQPPWYTTDTLPEPSAGMAGTAACVRDAGAAGYEVVCLPDESGAWHWYRRTLAVPAF